MRSTPTVIFIKEIKNNFFIKYENNCYCSITISNVPIVGEK